MKELLDELEKRLTDEIKQAVSQASQKVKRQRLLLKLGGGVAEGRVAGGGNKELWVKVIEDATEVLSFDYEPYLPSPPPPLFPEFAPMVLGPENNIRGVGVIFKGGDQRNLSSQMPCTLAFNVVYLAKPQ